MICPIDSALLSCLSYSRYKITTNKYKLVKHISDNGTDASCSIFTVDDTIVLSFTGTESFKDIPSLIKLNKKRVNIDGISLKIHKGFLLAYLSLHEEIQKVLDSIEGIDKIHFTGHSMGGAMANIALLYNHKKFKYTSVHTFASPMFSNTETAMIVLDICDDYKRFSIKLDVITYLPSSLLGYKHPCKAIVLDKINSSSYNTIIYNLISNHKCKNYIKSVLIYVGEKEIVKNIEDFDI
jgi:hypothetical protein